jgi:hypothetical protein
MAADTRVLQRATLGRRAGIMRANLFPSIEPFEELLLPPIPHFDSSGFDFELPEERDDET